MTSFVYFLKPVDMDGPIKIGCSETPKGRLSTYMSWSPLKLEMVASIPGDLALERNLHECFADIHSHGEWFHAHERLTSAIDKIKRGVHVGDAVDLNRRVGKITPKRVGGAAWSDLTRQKMSVLARVRHALNRIGVHHQRMVPKHLEEVCRASEKRILTSEEMASILEFTSNPEKYKDECLPRFEAWLRAYDRRKAA